MKRIVTDIFYKVLFIDFLRSSEIPFDDNPAGSDLRPTGRHVVKEKGYVVPHSVLTFFDVKADGLGRRCSTREFDFGEPETKKEFEPPLKLDLCWPCHRETKEAVIAREESIWCMNRHTAAAEKRVVSARDIDLLSGPTLNLGLQDCVSREWYQTVHSRIP